MRKLNYFLAALALFLGFGTLHANETDTISNYLQDFEANLTQNTDVSYPVAGWRILIDPSHSVRSYNRNRAGVNNSYALGYSSTQNADAINLVVSPKVKGTASVYVKKFGTNSRYASSVEFYKVAEVNGQLVVDQKIDVTVPELTTTMQQVNIPVGDTPTRIGVRLSYAYMDNFEATTAFVEKVNSLSITGVSWNATGAGNKNSEYYIDADGNIKVSYYVNLRNIGDFDLKTGDANYSISIYDPTTNAVVATVPINKDMNAHTQVYSFPVEGTVKYADHKNPFRLSFKENVSGTDYSNNSSTPLITPISNEPKLTFTRTYTSDTLHVGDIISFPTITNSSTPFPNNINVPTKTYRIANNGGSDLVISNLKVSNGFKVTLDDTTIGRGLYKSITLENDHSVVGYKTGTLTFTTNENGGTNYSYNLVGQVVDTTAYFEGVTTWNFPAELINENSHWKTIGNNQIPEKEHNSSCLYTAKTNSGKDITGKVITPLLNITASGISFLAAPYMSDDAELTVYYSKDRKNWTTAADLKTSDGTLPIDTVWVTRGGKQYRFSRHTLTNIPAGQYYIGFDGKNVNLDDIIAEGGKVALKHDVILESQSVPAKGNVNREYKASIGVKNALATTEKTATATLYFDNTAVATQTDSVSGYTSKSFDYSYYPRTAGSYKAYIVVDFGDEYKVSTDTVNLVISKEDGNRSVATADVKTVAYNAPVITNSVYSEAEVYYSPEQLGLNKGDVIKGITFKGATRSNTDATPTEAFDEHIRVWIAERDTDRIFVNNDEIADTAKMSKVYDSINHFVDGGSYGNWDSSVGGYVIDKEADLLTITFNKPYVYQGGYLDFVYYGNSLDEYGHATLYYMSDLTDKDHAISRNFAKPDNPYNARFTNSPLPVSYFDVESKVATVTGTITDKSTNKAIEGAAVTYTHGGIVYSDTTDNKGAYSIPVYETGYPYNVEVEATGYYPVKEVDTIRVSAVKNYQLDGSGALYIESFGIPSRGTYNHALKATAKAINYSDFKQTNYTAKLYIDGKAVADGTPHNDVEIGATQDFTFAYTPHETGTFPAYIQFATGDSKFTSDTVSITIAPESASGTVQVGDSTTNGSNAPVHLGDKNTQSETIYTAEQLGLSAGANITRIYYKSACGNNKTIHPHIVVWLENTDDLITSANVSSYQAADTTKMTKVWDGDRSFSTKHGKNSGTWEYDTLYTFTLPQAFRYDGRNLRVVVHTYSDQYQSGFNFMTDGRAENKAIYRSNDNYNTLITRSFSDARGIPVLFVEYSSPKLTGKVYNADSAAVAGAVVKIASGDVYYTDTTAADGSYSIAVPQNSLTYVGTAEAEGYVTDSVPGIEFPVGDVEQDFVLKTIPTISGAVVSGTDSIAGAIVTLTSGDVVLTDTTDAKGLYSIAVARPSLTYTANITAEGYLPATESDINVADEGTKKDFALRKIPTVSGAVKSDTTAIAGAAITLKSDSVVYTATTDAKGEYSISVPNIDLTFTANVTADGYLPAEATGISVAKSDTIVNFNLRPIPTISGVVTDGVDSIAGATITLKSDTVVYTATTDAKGAYSIKVPEASLTYVATVTADEFEPDSIANITFEKGDTVVNFVLTYTPIELTIPASGWTTFSNAHKVALPEGVKAYTVPDMTANYVQLKEVSDFAAGEGVVIQGAAGTYKLTVVVDTKKAPAENADVNLLVGTAAADYTVDNASVGKVLTFTDDKGAAGFKKAAAGDIVAKGHAYLKAKDGLTVSDNLQTGTIPTTGINAITTDGKLDESKPMYDLGGARVPKSYRGVVIQNGKKFIKK